MNPDSRKKLKAKPYIYIDNSAWSDFVFGRKRSEFQVTTDHLDALRKSSFQPVLSDFNCTEACEMLLSYKKIREGQNLLRNMADLAEQRQFLDKDLVNWDYQLSFKRIKPIDFFTWLDLSKRREFAMLLKCASSNPRGHLETFRRVSSHRKKYNKLFSEMLSHARNAGLREQENLDRIAQDRYQYYYEGLTQNAYSHIRNLMFELDIDNYQLKSFRMSKTLHRSIVAVSYIKCLAAMGCWHVDNRRAVDINDPSDALHYMLSSFCDFFVTSDGNLIEILSKIPDSPCEVIYLPDFIQKYLT